MSKSKNSFEEWKENLGETRPWDLVNPNTKYADEALAEKRFSICKGCPELTAVTSQCKKCGCFMHIKTKLELATCPLNRW